jgi:hypothetical protein
MQYGAFSKQPNSCLATNEISRQTLLLRPEEVANVPFLCQMDSLHTHFFKMHGVMIF